MTGVPPRPSPSLSIRLVAAALVWVVLLLAAGGGVLAFAFRGAVEEEYGRRLDALLKTVVASIEVAPGGALGMTRPLGDPRFDRLYSGWYWQVTAPDGQQLRSRSLWDATLAPHKGGPDLQLRTMTGPNGEPLLVAERDVAFAGQSAATHVLVAGDRREVSDGVRRFDVLLALSLGLLGLGVMVAIVLQVRFGLRPLRALVSDLRAVRQGDAPRLAGRYPVEVAPLADGFNEVLDRDAELIERARTHVGNLAHALKTPLAVASAEIQGERDAATLRAQVEAMRRIVEHHLARARSSVGAGRYAPRVPVRPVAEAAVAVLSKVYRERGLSIEVVADESAAFRGHREDLEEILGNLLENACKWATRRVRLTAAAVDGGLSLDIEDDGPGLDAAREAEFVGRGKRLDEKVPGWGLGLSIVSDLVDVHGGTLRFARSPLGGLGVTVTLPRVA
ncbi:MAG: sensor histidine kinase [Proteobacteria bacterium]|nr:sensor histidine kinase [Pseudomonadota bacterium]